MPITPKGDVAVSGEATDRLTLGRGPVSIELPADHIKILREEISGWLEGQRDDLQTPERLPDARRSRRRAETYERLLAGLDGGEILLPDEEAQAAVEAAAKAYDEASDYHEIAATHDAQHAFLDLLRGEGS